MKKQHSGLSKAEREKVEAEYHRMKPEDFDDLMSRAKPGTAANVANSSATRSRSKRKNRSTEKKRAA